MNKDDILKAIHETAQINKGKPLGRERFIKETGISDYEIGKYWARYGDAVIEAGLEPNKLQGAYDTEFLIKKAIHLTRELGKIPTSREMVVERNRDSSFPNKGAFYRLGAKKQLINKILDFARSNSGFEDIISICEEAIEKLPSKKPETISGVEVGEVYLFKSGKYFKIGKTNDTVRRGKEIRIQLPERTDMVHTIKTDDPSGVEAYWHRRFESKRKQGEWFDLNSEDVRAFKRWKRIV